MSHPYYPDLSQGKEELAGEGITFETRYWDDNNYLSEGNGVLEAWKVMRDFCNAIRYGYEDTFLPTPGAKINASTVNKKMQHMDKEWAEEWETRANHEQTTPHPDFENMPDLAQQSLWEQVSYWRKFWKKKNK